MYGKAEAVTGDLLDSMDAHEKAFVATKVWTSGRQSGIDEMNDSLRKLQCEQIELMQVHNLVDCDTQLSTLRDWKQEGRIKYIGITHYATSGFGEMGRFIKDYPVEKFYRDVKLTTIGEGTSEIQRLVIARKALE